MAQNASGFQWDTHRGQKYLFSDYGPNSKISMLYMYKVLKRN